MKLVFKFCPDCGHKVIAPYRPCQGGAVIKYACTNEHCRWAMVTHAPLSMGSYPSEDYTQLELHVFQPIMNSHIALTMNRSNLSNAVLQLKEAPLWEDLPEEDRRTLQKFILS